MKRSLILSVLSISLCSCGTSMQNNPAAIQIGASVGGVVGSILGENANGYHGWVVGNMLGTVAGAAIGDAVANAESKSQIRNREENNSYSYNQQPTDGDKLINPSENSQTFPVDIEN